MADKYLYNNAGTITEKTATDTSAGAADAGKVVALDTSGRLATSMMPVGIAADTSPIIASEALAAGNWVNEYNNAGTATVRKADATVAGKEASGFVLAAVASGAVATVYFEGSNTAVTGQTPGVVYLSTTAGTGAPTAASGSGNVVQRIGYATSATSVNFEPQQPIVLA